MPPETYEQVTRRWPTIQAWAEGGDVSGPTLLTELRDLTEYLGGSSAPLALDAEESRVMGQINAAMSGIQDLGLKANGTELASAVHVLQGFVVQHMLERLAPGTWGRWYEEVPDAG